MVKDIKKLFEQPTFASKGGLKEFNDEQRAKGWESIGKEAPESTQFNVLQNDVERGVKYLYGQIRETIRSTSPNYVPDEMKATDLREAVEGITQAQTAQAIQQAKNDAAAANKNAESRLAKAANLSDIADTRQARENLGLGKLALANDYPEASLSQKGIVQLSSATDSDSETMAATPKAVKAIADTLSGGRLLNIQSFTESGIYTPTPGTQKIRVKCWGAGGGGAGMSKQNRGSVAGAAGAYAEALLDVTPLSSVSVEVGTGGGASPAGVSQDGGDGGGSSFGSLVFCEGGGGGIIKNGLSVSGKPTGGNVMMVFGQSGQGGTYASGLLINGVGGASFGGYNAQPHVSTSGDDGSFPGGGGAMGAYVDENTHYASGRGGDGLIIIEEYS